MNFAASLQGLPDLTGHPYVQRVVKHSPVLLSAALTLAIAWQASKLTWLVLPKPADDPRIVLNIPTAAPAGSGNDIQAIADAHLFGIATASDEPLDAANAPVTQMPLVLAGVMASPDPTKGYAFIGESANAAKFRRVGDSLPGGARLHSVYTDRVMLDRNGRLEALLLPRYNSAASYASAPQRPAPTPTGFAQDLRRIAETNPAAFAEIVRPQPVFAGGVQKGYRVYPGRNRQQFAKLGLLPGDLVTAVNGTPLSDQANGMQIFNTISTMNQVTLTVERNGQTQQVEVNTAEIQLPDPTGRPPIGVPPAEAGAPPDANAPSAQ